MTREGSSSPPPAAAPPPRGRAWAYAWRLALIVLVVVATVAVAHLVRDPAGVTGGADGPGAGGPGSAFFEQAGAAGGPSPQEDEAARRQGAQRLRDLMAGLVMAASDEAQGPFEDPGNQDAESRRRFLAERFGLPVGYPRSEAPADLPPRDAQVLVVFQDPHGQGNRMVLVRVAKDLHTVLSDLQNQYAAAGWKVVEPVDPRAQTDQGWLVRFAHEGQRRERLVYARVREADPRETLAVIYEARY